MKILVLCGGETAERVVSWASGDAVANWLTEAGYDVLKYDPEQPGRIVPPNVALAPKDIGVEAPPLNSGDGYNSRVVRGLLEVLDRERPDLVFPIFHGGYGEGGVLQGLLDWMGMPYTGSGPLASAMAMDKQQTRLVLQTVGVPIAKGFALSPERADAVDYAAREVAAIGGFPVVVKPLHGGSTVGLTKVYQAAELPDALRAVREQRDDVLIETLFDGRELTCAVIEGEAYPVIEIRPRAGFYDYANKYTDDRTDYLCPAPIPPAVAARIQADAVKAFEAIGCRGFARIDFMLNSRDEYICLEVNSLPGMTTHSLVPMAVRGRGETLPGAMQRIVEAALRTATRTV